MHCKIEKRNGHEKSTNSHGKVVEKYVVCGNTVITDREMQHFHFLHLIRDMGTSLKKKCAVNGGNLFKFIKLLQFFKMI